MNGCERNVCDWIVCEQSSRWAAAFRTAFDRSAHRNSSEHRLQELRRLAELSKALAERPTALAAIEVRRANFGDVLTWLVTNQQRAALSRCVALVDRSLEQDHSDCTTKEQTQFHEIIDALCEAGAVDVVVSPRRLGPLIELTRRYAARAAREPVPDNMANSMTARVWASLPWQAG
jgi:pyruvate-formate lyase